MSNLDALHEKVGAFFGRIAAKHADQITCASGCSGCCNQSLSLFQVELQQLKGAVESLPAPALERLKARLTAGLEVEDPSALACPLLDDHRCVVYDARPTICRSHGVPVLVRGSDEGDELTQGELARRDVCPLNFSGALDIRSLPDADVLDLERLNTMLALINRLSLQEVASEVASREPLREALVRWLGVTA